MPSGSEVDVQEKAGNGKGVGLVVVGMDEEALRRIIAEEVQRGVRRELRRLVARIHSAIDQAMAAERTGELLALGLSDEEYARRARMSWTEEAMRY